MEDLILHHTNNPQQEVLRVIKMSRVNPTRLFGYLKYKRIMYEGYDAQKGDEVDDALQKVFNNIFIDTREILAMPLVSKELADAALNMLQCPNKTSILFHLVPNLRYGSPAFREGYIVACTFELDFYSISTEQEISEALSDKYILSVSEEFWLQNTQKPLIWLSIKPRMI